MSARGITADPCSLIFLKLHHRDGRSAFDTAANDCQQPTRARPTLTAMKVQSHLLRCLHEVRRCRAEERLDQGRDGRSTCRIELDLVGVEAKSVGHPLAEEVAYRLVG